MKRDSYDKLLAWKRSPRRKPLLLRGARQVGKTWLLSTFAKNEYEDFCYLNFEEDKVYKDFFNGSLNPLQIVRNISAYFGKDINADKTLIILDEIQLCPEALTSLKYFSEQAKQYHIVGAGSLLGIKLADNSAFPVGKVNIIDLYPLTFFEFLSALNKEKLREYLEQELVAIEPLLNPLHEQLIELLRYYLFVGGMPEAVKSYVDNENLTEVREIQKEILETYLLDFAKHAPPTQTMRISTVWESIPNQLAKENKKFIFSALAKSARAREYEIAIQWLVDAGLIYKSSNITKPYNPLSSYTDNQAFKIFLVDVGLLGAMSQLEAKSLLQNETIFTEFKGALSENFIAQELIPLQDKKLYYWTSEGKAEIDFIISDQSKNFPLEVKYGTSQKKKSLGVYNDKYNPTLRLRTSSLNLKCDGNLCNIPLYLISQFSKLIGLINNSDDSMN